MLDEETGLIIRSNKMLFAVISVIFDGRNKVVRYETYGIPAMIAALVTFSC